jgi:hypothetical protein
MWLLCLEGMKLLSVVRRQASVRQGAVAAALLAAVLGGSGCRPTLAGLKSLDLVPEGSTVSGGMDLGRLRTSQALARLRAPGRNFNRLYPKMVSAFGFDPLADIDAVRFVQPRSGSKGSLTVATGRFDPPTALAQMNIFRRQHKQPDLEVTKFRQHLVHSIPGRPDSAFAFGDRTRLMGGPPMLVKLALDLLDRPGDTAGSTARALSQLLRDRSLPPHTAWLNVQAPATPVASKKRGRRPPLPYRVTSARGSFDITDRLTVNLHFQLQSEAEARLCADALRTEIVKLQNNTLVQLAGYREFLDVITVQADGRDAVVNAVYPPALVGRMLDLIERGMQSGLQRRTRPPAATVTPAGAPSPSPAPEAAPPPPAGAPR